MLDRSKCKKMWVWDGDGPNPKINQGTVFEILPNGECKVPCGEYDFINYLDFDYDTWDHCEEIHEPKYRAFLDGEMPEEWRDYWYREKGQYSIFRPWGYACIGGTQLFLNCWYSNCKLFIGFEVQKTPGGEWGIVGVEENE